MRVGGDRMRETRSHQHPAIAVSQARLHSRQVAVSEGSVARWAGTECSPGGARERRAPPAGCWLLVPAVLLLRCWRTSDLGERLRWLPRRGHRRTRSIVDAPISPEPA
jgi:hypothetical protein